MGYKSVQAKNITGHFLCDTLFNWLHGKKHKNKNNLNKGLAFNFIRNTFFVLFLAVFLHPGLCQFYCVLSNAEKSFCR